MLPFPKIDSSRKLAYKPATLTNLGTLAVITRANAGGYAADMNFVTGMMGAM